MSELTVNELKDKFETIHSENQRLEKVNKINCGVTDIQKIIEISTFAG